MPNSSKAQSFVPDAENTRQLRDAFGRFATGVTIVTTMTDEGPIAITANSFSSVSLSPAMVLWSPDKNSRRFGHFERAEHYAIHVLGSDQEELCWKIVKDANGLSDMELNTNAEGVPIIEGCLARFECTRASLIDAGDHAIILGNVNRASLQEDGDALGFFKGKMGVFSPKD